MVALQRLIDCIDKPELLFPRDTLGEGLRLAETDPDEVATYNFLGVST